MKGPCSIEGCGLPVVARGWCNKHYTRWYHHGDPLVVFGIPRGTPASERLEVYSERRGACLEWVGDRRGNGYGRITIDGRSYATHKLTWELANGPVPHGMFVCHTCDNPPCREITYLFLGTPRDNVQDMIRKGRRPTLAGANHPRASFTQEQFEAVVSLAAGGMKYPEIAALYGVSRSSVWRAVKGLTQHERNAA